MTTSRYWDEHKPLLDALVGNSVVKATKDTLTLSDGTKLKFDDSNSDCCSWIELTSLSTTPNIITKAWIESPDDDYGAYQARVHVLTAAGEINLAVADGDASNGYYLHGFALNVEIIP